MMRLYIKIHKKYFKTINHSTKLKKHTKSKILALKNIFYQFFDKNFTKNHKILYF